MLYGKLVACKCTESSCMGKMTTNVQAVPEVVSAALAEPHLHCQWQCAPQHQVLASTELQLLQTLHAACCVCNSRYFVLHNTTGIDAMLTDSKCWLRLARTTWRAYEATCATIAKLTAPNSSCAALRV